MKIRNFLRKIRDSIFNYYARYVYFLSVRKANSNRLDGCELNADLKDGHIDIVTIAFNAEELIDKQIDLFRTHLKDENYTLFVIDNSTSSDKRRRIKAICANKGIAYAPVPTYINKLISTRLFNHGISHGAAINWAYYNIICKRKPTYFGTLDHDLLLTGDYSIADRLKTQDFYGVKRDRKDGWYLWAGFSFFKFERLKELKINFLPYQIKTTYLDSGGANYIPLYRKYDINEIVFTDDKLIRIQETKDLVSYNDIFHTDCIVRIDEVWIHIINGSNYTKQKGKELMMAKVLNRF